MRKTYQNIAVREIREAAKHNPSEWEYFINPLMEEVIEYMIENNLTKIVDLGAGVGHFVEVLSRLGFDARGYEIKDVYLEENAKIFNRVKPTLLQKKDIKTITYKDIERYDVIYTYAPFKEMDEYIEYLKGIMNEKQVILYKPSTGTTKVIKK